MSKQFGISTPRFYFCGQIKKRAMQTTVVTKYPVTLEERLELGPGEVRMPGRLEDFGELLRDCEFQIEFEDDTIIFMSIASDPHERIVANLLGCLYNIFKGRHEFRTYGSNRHVFFSHIGFTRAYSPDASIVLGKPEIVEYQPGLTANLNPWLIAEVMSESTRNNDLSKKLPRYKQLPSTRYLLYIEQNEPLVTLHYRDAEGTWHSTDYNHLDSSFEIEGRMISLADIYENVWMMEE
jgi:Uma2 family endonuclease